MDVMIRTITALAPKGKFTCLAFRYARSDTLIDFHCILGFLRLIVKMAW